jgi:hypothetical protein
MPAKGRVLPGDALDRMVDAVGYSLANTLYRIAHLSCASSATEGSRQLRGDEVDLAANGIRPLEIRPAKSFLELGSKVHEPRAILAPRARIEDIAGVGGAVQPLVR